MVPVNNKLTGKDRQSPSKLTKKPAAKGTEAATKAVVNGDIGVSMHLPNDARELEIPVPYGLIAGKEWGSPEGYPVLGLHGWQDNAGTFDHLVAYLPNSIHLVVLDFPGHGQSSHLPPGSMYGILQFLICIRRATEYLGWDKFSILGHSLGAIVGVYYAAIHPDCIDKLVSIDILNPGIRSKDSSTIRKFLDSFLKEEQREINVAYDTQFSEQDALKLMWTRRDGLTKEGAVPLYERGTKKMDKGLIFTRDHRLKPFLHQPWEYDSEDKALFMLKNMRAHMLILIASDSKLAKYPEELQEKIKNVYKENCATFQCIEIPGTHFVHLVDPATVAKHVSKFLTNDVK